MARTRRWDLGLRGRLRVVFHDGSYDNEAMATGAQDNPTAPGGGTAQKSTPGSLLGELLLRRSVITSDQLAEATSHQRAHGGQFAASLVRLGIVSEEDLTTYLRKEYRLPVVDPLTLEPTPEVLALVPDKVARKHSVLPVSVSGNTLVLATGDPSNLTALNECKFITGCDIRIVLAPVAAIQKAIDRHYSERAKIYTDVLSKLGEDDAKEAQRVADAQEVAALKATAEEAPLVRLVNTLLADAVDRRASDIHIEPCEKDLRIRFRIDGMLYDIMRRPPRVKAALASRVKIMASLDISERRLPQDGAIKMRLDDGREVNFRVSSLPTINGEKLVLRLLDKAGLQLDMTKLGFDERELKLFQSAIARPYGMVLVTGPTGSGKTTTLYSLIGEINKSVRNISTAEDPVELNIDGTNQVQINDDIDLTFATALRAFLRQDPDVIMVGEIRDYETAEIAVKAALTGHLVLSTLHTNDAPSSVTRLLDMGVEPFLVSSSVVLVAAQRLVRVICSHCKTVAESPPVDYLQAVGFQASQLGDLRLMHGKGCHECSGTGYAGRVALYEVLPISDEIREMIVGRAHAAEIRRRAVELGMRTLRASGVDKAIRGLTTIEEVLRVTAD